MLFHIAYTLVHKLYQLLSLPFATTFLLSLFFKTTPSKRVPLWCICTHNRKIEPEQSYSPTYDSSLSKHTVSISTQTHTLFGETGRRNVLFGFVHTFSLEDLTYLTCIFIVPQPNLFDIFYNLRSICKISSFWVSKSIVCSCLAASGGSIHFYCCVCSLPAQRKHSFAGGTKTGSKIKSQRVFLIHKVRSDPSPGQTLM